MNPRTQNKDFLEDSVSTSPDPSKSGGKVERRCGGMGWSQYEEAGGSPIGREWSESPHDFGVPEGSVIRALFTFSDGK